MVREHICQQGECLLSIADRYGYASAKSLYDHPDNKSLKASRCDPLCLMPGDKVALPEKNALSVTGQTGKQHHFVITGSKAYLTMALLDYERKALSNIEFTLKLSETKTDPITGRSDDQGHIHAQVPMDAHKTELTLRIDDQDPDSDIVLDILIGHRDPVETVSGRQARLNALGNYCGTVDNVEGKYTQAALSQFKNKQFAEQTNPEAVEQRLNLLQHPSDSTISPEQKTGVAYRGHS